MISLTLRVILHMALEPFPASMSRASLVSDMARCSRSIMLQARLNRSFSRLSTVGYLASFSCMVGERPRFSGHMDLLLGEGSLTHLHLPAAAFLHK